MSNKKFEFIVVDFQKDFTTVDGLCYINGESIDFVKNDLKEFFQTNKIKVHEIKSDYSLPRLNRTEASCVPNTDGFLSDLSEDVRYSDPWIKCMHNPLWIRKNIGKANRKQGKPYQDSKKFNKWLINHIGLPEDNKEIVLFGLSMEVCILSVAQELYFRGYNVKVLYEATDPMNIRMEYKDFIAENSSLTLYANVIFFEEVKTLILGSDING